MCFVFVSFQETRLADLAKRYESQLKKITTELKSKAKELDAARYKYLTYGSLCLASHAD